MATITLQHNTRMASQQARLITGRVTGNQYYINPIGNVTVDVRDSYHMLTEGWTAGYGVGNIPTSGFSTVNFGAFPGSPFASVTIAAVDASDPNAVIDAWVVPIATTDHTADEHVADPPRVIGSTDGNGNVIIVAQPSGRDLPVPAGTPFGQVTTSQMPIGEQQAMPYGKWSVGWAFSP